jgi:hypothetical protein
MTFRNHALAFGVAALLAGPGFNAAAAENVVQKAPAPDACSKIIAAMGATMGHTADVAPDGRPIYRFVLRTNGLDYDVACDAATGVIGDVTPRMSH